jgi:hypothetical protein
MGKKFKGKTCVYCGIPKSSQTGDHIFAREFFLPDRRKNLPQVPACEKCNNEKSGLEHYLTAILPFGGRHADAFTNLEKMTPPRLEKNKKLLHQISGKREYIWAEENGIFRLSMKIPFDSCKLDKLFCLIVKGLIWHHWKVLLTSNIFVRAGSIMKAAEQLFQNFFNGISSQRVNNDLGKGTIRYEGIQSVECPYLSLWKFSFYGGLKFGDDPKAPSETPTLIWGLTGKTKAIPDIWLQS